MFCDDKDHTRFQKKTDVVYRIMCRDCCNKYIWKTDTYITTRMDEHSIKPDQPMCQYVTNCAQFAGYLMHKFYALPDIDIVNTTVSQDLHLHNADTENTEIIYHNYNLDHL